MEAGIRGVVGDASEYSAAIIQSKLTESSTGFAWVVAIILVTFRMSLQAWITYSMVATAINYSWVCATSSIDAKSANAKKGPLALFLCPLDGLAGSPVWTITGRAPMVRVPKGWRQPEIASLRPAVLDPLNLIRLIPA